MNTYDNYFVFNMFDARFSVKKSRALETYYSKHSWFFRLNSVGWAIKSQQTNKNVRHE